MGSSRQALGALHVPVYADIAETRSVSSSLPDKKKVVDYNHQEQGK